MVTETPHIKQVWALETIQNQGGYEHENVSRYLYLAGDTAHNNQWGICIQFKIRGDTAHEIMKMLIMGMGIQHKIQRQRKGGWLALSMIIVPILAPSCKLKHSQLS